MCITEDRRNAELASRHLSTRLETVGVTTHLRLWADGERWRELNSGATGLQTQEAAERIAASASVTLAGGAQTSNVFWVVTGAAGTGANTVLAGSILAEGAVTLGASTLLEGRALSLGTVTLAANTLTGVTPAPAVVP